MAPRSRAKPSLLFGNRELSARYAASKPTGRSKMSPTGPPLTEKNGEIGIHSIWSRRPSSFRIACLGSPGSCGSVVWCRAGSMAKAPVLKAEAAPPTL